MSFLSNRNNFNKLKVSKDNSNNLVQDNNSRQNNLNAN